MSVATSCFKNAHLQRDLDLEIGDRSLTAIPRFLDRKQGVDSYPFEPPIK